MDAEGIRGAFDEVFDQGLVFHGYAEYMRDYDLFVYATADPRTGIKPQNLRYRFVHCVSVSIASTVSPDIWARSLDERLVDHETGRDLDGYVWGVNWQVLYPGMELVPDSQAAATWADALGIAFYEATIEGNAHKITLVFHDLRVDTLPAGRAPFVTEGEGPDAKIPLA